MKTTGKDFAKGVGGGHCLNRACLLLTLAFIILVPSNLPSSSRPSSSRTHWPGGLGIISAEANYLEEVGRVSQAMNQLVDALLQKVSFMAEIIIESSMSEQCEASCSAAPSWRDRDTQTNNSGGSREGGSNWIDRTPAGSRIRADRFDRREFTNVDLFLEMARARYDDTGHGDAAKCQLFNFDIDRQDLPIAEMATCCKAFTHCYARCGQSKLDCDLEFQTCLRNKCRQRFDYTNETVVRAFHQLEKRRALLEPLDEPSADSYDEDEDEDDDNDDLDSKLAEGSRVAAEPLDEDEDNEEVEGRVKRSSDGDQPEEEPQRGLPEAGLLGMSEREVKRLRDKYKACKLATKVLIIGNLAFGCQKYKRSQWRACCDNGTVGGGNNGEPGIDSSGPIWPVDRSARPPISSVPVDPRPGAVLTDRQ